MPGDEVLVVEKPRGKMAVVDDVLHDDLADLFGLLDAFGGHVENGIDQITAFIVRICFRGKRLAPLVIRVRILVTRWVTLENNIIVLECIVCIPNSPAAAVVTADGHRGRRKTSFGCPCAIFLQKKVYLK